MIDSESQAPITGLSVALVGGYTYWIRGAIMFKGDSTQKAYLTLSASGLVASLFYANIAYGVAAGDAVQQTVLGTNTGLESGDLVNGDYYVCRIDGIISVTTGGNLVADAATSANSDGFTVQIGSLLQAGVTFP